MLAISDANYCFIAVDIGDYGKNSDSSIFKNSTFYRKLVKKELNIPENTLLPQSNGSKFPFVIVGDEAFGLSQNVMRPYGGRHLSTKKKFLIIECQGHDVLSNVLLGFSQISGESSIYR